MDNDQQLARVCLALLSPTRATNYDEWVLVGMALYHSGCDVSDWINWYPDGAADHERECLKKWDSFKNDTGNKRTVASLVKWAKADSGKDPHSLTTSHKTTGLLSPDHRFGTDDSAPWNPDLDLLRYVEAVFRPGDIISYVSLSNKTDKGKWVPSGKGVYKMTYEAFVDELKGSDAVNAIGGQYNQEAGVWVRHNPLDGEGVANKNVVDLRYVLVENDDLPRDQQLAIIKQLNLPCAAIVDAGNKSIHAIVRIDAGTDVDLYRERVKKLYATLKEHNYNVDAQCKNEARLSRLPGFMRNGRRQTLIETNAGCSSWLDWIDHLEAQDRNIFTLKQLLAIDVEAEDDSLILPRFVCQEGAWMIVSQSGIGKSSLMMQMAIAFAAGLEIFGLAPARPLKSLVIQAENNRLDLVEPVQGIHRGLELNKTQRALANDNVLILSEDTRTGDRFCSWLDRVVAAYMPVDLVWIDPLLAYAGCDISKQADASAFFRNMLNPIIHKHKFACCIIHHTPKVRKKSQDDDYDLSYIGAGSAELTNWARSVSIIEKTSDNPITANFQHVKRHGRLAKKSAQLAHATDGSIFWKTIRKSLPDELEQAEKIARKMPRLFDRRDRNDADSLHRWCIENLPLHTPKACVDFAERHKARANRCADRIARGEAAEHLKQSVFQRIDVNGQFTFAGVETDAF